MTYADPAYYREVYGGTAIPESAQALHLGKASEQIDSITYNRILASGFSSLSTFQQDRVRKAVCSQADFMYQYGAYLDMPVSGFSAGSVSLSFKTVDAAGGVKTSDVVVNLLKSTGLMDRRL